MELICVDLPIQKTKFLQRNVRKSLSILFNFLHQQHSKERMKKIIKDSHDMNYLYQFCLQLGVN